MEKPYVSDVINYCRDIEPYGFIQINAGVGSGKSTFINNLIKGYTGKNDDGTEYTVPPKRVLLITSRRAKVNEILNDDSMSIGAYVMEWDNNCPFDDIDEYLKSEMEITAGDSSEGHRVHQRSIACTNAAIEKFLQNNYLPSDTSTHLWQRFDFIVWDEVHSVLADASYQSAPFYVHKLVNRAWSAYNKKESTCKVILMTGSPRILKKFNFPQKGKLIDLMDTCRSVVPQSLSFVDTVEAKKGVLRRLENGERVIYFANHIKTILEFYAELSAELQAVTAFSFTQTERLDDSDPAQKNLLDRMKATEKEISEKQMLPENVKLLLTTSKNKEGINIWNEDIKAVYVENHAEVDIIQMAGRARKGVKCLYVVTDSGGFGKTEGKWECMFSEDEVPIDALEFPEEHGGGGIKQLNLVEYVNHHFEYLCRKSEINLKDEWRKPTYHYKQAADYIDFIHGKFPYIRYNYLAEKFDFYFDRKQSIDYFDKQAEEYKAASGDKVLLKALAQSWFENILVIWPEDIQSQIDKYLAGNRFLNVPYDNEMRKRIKADLEIILGKAIGQLKNTLEKYGYTEKDCSKNKKADTYGKKKIVKL